MHGFDWSDWKSNSGTDRLRVTAAGKNHIFPMPKSMYSRKTARSDSAKPSQISKAFALCATADEAMRCMTKFLSTKQCSQSCLKQQIVRALQRTLTMRYDNWSIKQLSDGEVIDVFTAAGVKKPDISILSDEFLSEVRGIKQKNVAAELLAKLLKDQISTRSSRNVVQGGSLVRCSKTHSMLITTERFMRNSSNLRKS